MAMQAANSQTYQSSLSFSVRGSAFMDTQPGSLRRATLKRTPHSVLMSCCCNLEILNFKQRPLHSFCTGVHKWCSQSCPYLFWYRIYLQFLIILSPLNLYIFFKFTTSCPTTVINITARWASWSTYFLFVLFFLFSIFPIIQISAVQVTNGPAVIYCA